MKGLVWVFLLVVFSTAVIFGLGGYFLGRRLPSLSKSIESAYKQEISTLDPSYSPPNWVTYTNKEYEFSVKYNLERKVIETKGSEETGQFTYLYRIDFGFAPFKNEGGYILEVDKVELPIKLINHYKLELVGHETDKIESVQNVEVNGLLWTKLNYQQFLSTDYVKMTRAFTVHYRYTYEITARSEDVDSILASFRILPD